MTRTADTLQLNIFDLFPTGEETLIKKSLIRGSGFVGGKERIADYYMENGSKGFANYLKNEYGIGGYADSGEWLTSDAKGILIEKLSEKIKIELNWNEVANKIAMYIESGEYNKREVRI